MSTSRRGTDAMQADLEAALEEGARRADPVEVAEADSRLDELLEKVDAPRPEPAANPAREPAVRAGAVALPAAVLRTAVAVAVAGRCAQVRVRGLAEPFSAVLDAGVSAELVEQAAQRGDRVLLEQVDGADPVVVGVVQTHAPHDNAVPEELSLKAKRIVIEGEQEVLLRSGRGAMRVRQDGDVELVGSRISAMSRGLFRLVGRVLRLN